MITITLAPWLLGLFIVLLVVDLAVHLPRLGAQLHEWWIFHQMTAGAWQADKAALERARAETVKAESDLHDIQQKAAERGIYLDEPK